MIPIYKPYLSKYKTSALTAIDSEWISNYGVYVDLSTDAIKTQLNIPYCVLMNNGTSATHALFKALKFKHPHIEKIYLPNNVFIAPYNCALAEYDADQLEILRVDADTLNMDVSEAYVNSLAENSAVVIVHNLGNVINVPRLKRLRPDLIFVEDNCEGLFGKYESMYTGSFSGTLASSVSFYGNKTITTGEGGAFFTHDVEVYKFIKCYYSHGMSSERYIHSMLGTNYRMTNIQAAFLYDQMNDINAILELKRHVFARYIDGFADVVRTGKMQLLQCEPDTENSQWMFVVFIPGISYKMIEAYLAEKQIQVRPIFYDVSCHPYLHKLARHDPACLEKTQHGFMLPSFPELSPTHQNYIISSVISYIRLYT